MKTSILIVTENNGVRTARTTVIENGNMEMDQFTYEYDEEEQKYIVPVELDDWQTEHVGHRPNDRG